MTAAIRYNNRKRDSYANVAGRFAAVTAGTPDAIRLASIHASCVGFDIVLHKCPVEQIVHVEEAHNIVLLSFNAIGLTQQQLETVFTLADEIWCDCEFSANLVMKAGFQKPVCLIPSPVNIETFHPAEPTSEQSVVRLGYVGWWTKRKDVGTLVEAYVREFSQDDNVELYLSLTTGASSDTRRIAQNLSELNQRLRPSAKVVVDYAYRNPDQLATLYQSFTALASASRGEGFCSSFNEALACGVPLIANPWAGTADILTDSTGYPVEYRMEGLAMGKLSTQCAKSNLSSLREQLRLAYGDAIEAKKRGTEGRALVTRRSSYPVVLNAISDRFKAIRGR